MAFNKHLQNEDYRRLAHAIVDDTSWSDPDLAKDSYEIVKARVGRELNDAELGEIWTHVIGIDLQYAVLAGSEAEAAFLACGEVVDYDEAEADEPVEGCDSCECSDEGQ